MTKIRSLMIFALLAGVFVQPAFAAPKGGIAMHGEPALPDGFTSLPYANPDAPQGGMLRQALTGTFDSLNPFIVKGNAAQGGRTYVFESLMARNWGEPFSLYGLLAQSIDVSDDRQVFTFKIRPEAKFSDGTPVTAADVQFSLETLRDHGRPNFKNNYSKISKIETPDDHTITFTQEKGDRELPLIIALMPILPKAQWAGKDFEASSLEPMVGSGPYKFGEIKPGESVTLVKNPDYWGKALPINKGVWNFETLRFDYYKDANATFEAFKKGDADIRIETDPVRWSTGYKFPAVDEGKVKLETYVSKMPAPTNGLAFNTRKPLFADARVREALTMAFDFEWANANLFNNLNKRIYGYYSGSMLSSQGKAADAAELAVLGDAAKTLRPDMLDGSYKLPVTDGSGHDRKVLHKAVDLLASAGWKIGDNGLVNDKGEGFAFTITIPGPEQEKIALHYQRMLQLIGIKVDVKKVDDTQFKQLQTTYDYDMIPVTWYNSLSPGNEQTLYFGSGGKTAQGTRNYPGIADPAVDHAIEAMLHAQSQEDFAAAVRAEDRLLVAGFYIVPFYTNDQWVGRWTRTGSNPPDKQPLPGFEATTLWAQP
ncbi:MAG: ABC transporter substrate-binding protein [Alphaproteobacteria bacterium]|nr:ABC transporter substrate-binding protein [Alphaproteobacteria bacterium]